jgi:prostasin
MLQTVTKPIVQFDMCAEIMATTGFILHYTMVCTGPLTGGISACGGDSGGPLVQDLNGDGIVSLNNLVFKKENEIRLNF